MSQPSGLNGNTFQLSPLELDYSNGLELAQNCTCSCPVAPARACLFHQFHEFRNSELLLGNPENSFEQTFESTSPASHFIPSLLFLQAMCFQTAPQPSGGFPSAHPKQCAHRPALSFTMRLPVSTRSRAMCDGSCCRTAPETSTAAPTSGHSMSGEEDGGSVPASCTK